MDFPFADECTNENKRKNFFFFSEPSYQECEAGIRQKLNNTVKKKNVVLIEKEKASRRLVGKTKRSGVNVPMN